MDLGTQHPYKLSSSSNKLLSLVFPNGVPDGIRGHNELHTYLGNLCDYKVDQLKKEQNRLSSETGNIADQTQDLAVANYKSFLDGAEKFQTVFSEFENSEDQVNILISELPKLNNKCEQFLKLAVGINEYGRLNSLTLKKSAQLLEILEIPQVMERCILEERYEEALELSRYVQRIDKNHGKIPVVKSIVNAVELLGHSMLLQLLAQLRTDMQLPKCLQIVGYLKRMQIFESSELKLKFLQTRNSWLTSILKAIPIDDAQQHLTKTIELTRINLFNIITQYKAVFPDCGNVNKSVIIRTDQQKPLKEVNCNSDGLFQVWLHEKIREFLVTLEMDLKRGTGIFDSILGQCMYFGLSFSRVGVDFRALMTPLFVNIIKSRFINHIVLIEQNFENEFGKYTLINKVTIYNRTVTASDTTAANSFAPPETLLDFHPLAVLCNGYLNALNDLRLCAPTTLANDVTIRLQQSLEMVSKRILMFFGQEVQAFTQIERDIFIKLCACFCYDLVPYIQKCVHAVFPPAILSAHLGLPLIALEEAKIGYFQNNVILDPLKCILTSIPHAKVGN